MELTKLFGRGIAGLGMAVACIMLAGCQSSHSNGPYSSDPLKGGTSSANNSGVPDPANAMANPNASNGVILGAGDTISVSFNDLTTQVIAIEEQIKEDGSVMLYFNEKFQAAGKTIRELQNEIHDRYVPKYYKIMTPSVKTQDRFFSVGGEVHTPNRYLYTPALTVLRAIDAGGGFTDFSKRTKVILTRANGKQLYENCARALDHPELDLPVYPGDKVFVKKKLW